MNLYVLFAIAAVLTLLAGYLFGRYTKLVIETPTAAMILILLPVGRGITAMLAGKSLLECVEDLSIGLAIAAAMGAGLLVGVKARRRLRQGSPDKH